MDEVGRHDFILTCVIFPKNIHFLNVSDIFQFAVFNIRQYVKFPGRAVKNRNDKTYKKKPDVISRRTLEFISLLLICAQTTSG